MQVAAKRKAPITPAEISHADLSAFVPIELANLGDPQTAIPRLAKDDGAVRRIEDAVRTIPTAHRLYLGDARELAGIAAESVHLVLTSSCASVFMIPPAFCFPTRRAEAKAPSKNPPRN